jgi:hypothetical protein
VRLDTVRLKAKTTGPPEGGHYVRTLFQAAGAGLLAGEDGLIAVGVAV